VKVKCKVAPVLMHHVWGSGGKTPRILYFNIKWKSVVSLTLQPP